MRLAKIIVVLLIVISVALPFAVPPAPSISDRPPADAIVQMHRASQPLRELFFTDQSLEEHVQSCKDLATIDARSLSETEDDWRLLFALALERKRAGDLDAARRALRRASELPDVESRVQLWAWTALRELGVTPDLDISDEVLGAVIEVALTMGTDTLAVYSDGTARYINQSGHAVLWDARTEESDDLIRRMLADAQSRVAKFPISCRDAKPPPGHAFRLTLLTRGGMRVRIVGPFERSGDEPMQLVTLGPQLIDFLRVQQSEQQNHPD